MIKVRYGRIAIGKQEGYYCLEIIDSNLIGKLSLKLPISYGKTIGQIIVRYENENFLFLHVNSQPFILEGHGYKRFDNDEKAENILRGFLKSPEAGKYAELVEKKLRKVDTPWLDITTREYHKLFENDE